MVVHPQVEVSGSSSKVSVGNSSSVINVHSEIHLSQATPRSIDLLLKPSLKFGDLQRGLQLVVDIFLLTIDWQMICRGRIDFLERVSGHFGRTSAHQCRARETKCVHDHDASDSSLRSVEQLGHSPQRWTSSSSSTFPPSEPFQ